MGKEKKTESYDNGSYNYKMFKCFNRKFKINEVQPTDDVRDAFCQFAVGCGGGGGDGDSSDGDASSGVMGAEQLCSFLDDHQGDSGTTVAEAQRLINEVIRRRHHVTRFTRHGLDLDDFFNFLFYDDLNPPITPHVHQDMSAPLSHYFIYTGHNSYLTGNQLSSDCSEVPVIKALQRGVRVIELDLWPNSTGTDINVLHGRTLTTPVPLISCLKAIRDYAFSSSPYPVIITLEDHLTADLQAKVAEMATLIFGEMLYYPESESLAEFPSPASLLHRIMISTKPPKEYLESSNPIVKQKDNNNASPSSEEETPRKEEIQTLESILFYEDCCENKNDSDQEEEEASEEQKPAYKRLITIHAGKPKGTVKEEMKVVVDKVRRLSLSEQELDRTCSSNSQDVVRFTQRNILRIYPKGTRFNSSNYKPLIGWIHGAQMIAFNMQGYGKSLWLMHGMFRANGGCGYVKKPNFLMKKGFHDEVFDPRKKIPVKETLKVKVYMGDGWRLDFSHTHFDSYSPPDFYTKVYVVGVPADNAKRKTRVIEDNWYPIWDEEFSFPLTVPELALLRIEVSEYDMSDKDDFGGQTCLPVSELRPGIRSVPLYDKKGEKMKSVKLLMRFIFE
ncbi:PREDICTED: phosphoinositide phospholipase C 6-like [Brassica oleracea var. oleracea]|uniref:Phosphoinositide phospholipase C n=1 Tax=Brassica oleracea var. oleracea TaxID=109376 RepID=A0A0D3BQC5_BRAOL|nr:PREDICTED: phosphoinositide phospholipase C 6-like [Brassica oleracea var. oleracea]